MKHLFGVLLLAGPVFATIEDEAKLFSPAAVAAAEKKLAEIKQSANKEILIITTTDLKGKSITQTTIETARSRKLNGAIILISTQPRMLEVVAGRKTAIVFTQEHEIKVRDIFVKKLRKQPNEALREAVAYIHDLFKKADAALIIADSHGPAVPAASAENAIFGGWTKWLIAAGVALLAAALTFFVIRRRAA